MDFSDVLSLLGFVVLLVGLFANRLNPLLAKNRRLLIIIGALTVVLTVGPEIVSGLIDGYKAGSTR